MTPYIDLREVHRVTITKFDTYSGGGDIRVDQKIWMVKYKSELYCPILFSF